MAETLTAIRDIDLPSLSPTGDRKARFCGDANASKVILNVLALNGMTLGIPCIYYGSEQCFDGQGGSDRYIREAMFGGEFGAFRTRGVHFFNAVLITLPAAGFLIFE